MANNLLITTMNIYLAVRKSHLRFRFLYPKELVYSHTQH